jgi:hypothetical protein
MDPSVVVVVVGFLFVFLSFLFFFFNYLLFFPPIFLTSVKTSMDNAQQETFASTSSERLIRAESVQIC